MKGTCEQIPFHFFLKFMMLVQADGHLAEKLSRLSDNVKFIVMEDGKCGSCIIEMPDGIIDMSVDTQLENIHRLVGNANT